MNQIESEIALQLDEIESRNRVQIIFAIESGSRAWGFASTNSDWDVRFVYAHTLDWYLKVQPQRDVIELPIKGDLDINGWELRKALRLMQNGNPVFYEWLDSPIVYKQEAALFLRLRELAVRFFNPIASLHHYRSMARSNYREYLQGSQVKTKKYLYVLRPLLACRWLERGLGQVPMLFETLLEKQLPDGPIRAAIDELLILKRGSVELGESPRILILNDFIEQELSHLEGLALTKPGIEDWARLTADAFLFDAAQKN